jgi:tRNA G46 methylase TrmB
MKKISLILVPLVLLGFVSGVFAQETELPDPGLTPDSPFYFFERIAEGVGTFFTFGDVAKAERYAKLAAERIAEAKAVVDKGKPEIAEKALIRYRGQLEKALAKAEQAQAKGKSVSEVTETVAQATAKHLTVLEEVLERVPEQAKAAIIRAREVSVTGQAKALENLANEKPERAADLNIQAIQGRLEKARNKAREGDEGGMERTITDIGVFQTSFEKMGKVNKTVLGSLVSEEMTGQIEDLDEVEDEAENISPQIAEKVQAIKRNAIDRQIGILGSLASVDPEKAAEIFSQAAERRLNRAKQGAEDRDAEEASEAVEEFEKYAAFGQEISEIAQGVGKDTTTVEQLVARATAHHLEVLNDVLGKVPAEAKEAIQKAMTVSEVGRQQAVEALKEKGALENIRETVPVPWEVRQRAKERVRQKIQEEKMRRPEAPPAEERPEVPPAEERPEEIEEAPTTERPEIPPVEGRPETPPAMERP